MAASISPEDPALWEKTPVYTVAVLGDIHEGKSQLVDAELDPAVNQPRPDILELGDAANTGGTTKVCTSYVGKVIEGRRIKIFDLPGVSDAGFLAEDEEAQDAGAPADRNKAAAVAAGAGGLVALLQNTFGTVKINLVLVVHPSNETAIKVGGQVLRCLIELGLMAGDKEKASKNIKIVFTKADELERFDADDRQIQREMLENKVLKDYFEGLGGSGGGADAEPKHCFTYGVPWNDRASLEEKKQRPKMKTVDTRELDDLIGQVIRARPNYHLNFDLPNESLKKIAEMGAGRFFTSAASTERFLKRHRATQDYLAWSDKNNLKANGAGNCHEERRRIGIYLTGNSHVEKATGAWAEELRKRDEFLHLRTTKKVGGPKGESRMTLVELEDEFIERGHIGQRPAPGERYPHKGGFKALCPPGGKRGDIAWALYQNATMDKDGFDGSERVEFVADEAGDAAPAPRPADGASSSASRSGTPAAASRTRRVRATAKPKGTYAEEEESEPGEAAPPQNQKRPAQQRHKGGVDRPLATPKKSKPASAVKNYPCGQCSAARGHHLKACEACGWHPRLKPDGRRAPGG